MRGKCDTRPIRIRLSPVAGWPAQKKRHTQHSEQQESTSSWTPCRAFSSPSMTVALDLIIEARGRPKPKDVGERETSSVSVSTGRLTWYSTRLRAQGETVMHLLQPNLVVSWQSPPNQVADFVAKDKSNAYELSSKCTLQSDWAGHCGPNVKEETDR